MTQNRFSSSVLTTSKLLSIQFTGMIYYTSLLYPQKQFGNLVYLLYILLTTHRSPNSFSKFSLQDQPSTHHSQITKKLFSKFSQHVRQTLTALRSPNIILEIQSSGSIKCRPLTDHQKSYL